MMGTDGGDKRVCHFIALVTDTTDDVSEIGLARCNRKNRPDRPKQNED
jgi:hypothetical protein